MTRDYSAAKIEEALKTAKGNSQIAQKLIIAKAIQDPKLLIELVKPHLTGIVGHAVNHVIKKQQTKSQNTQPEPKKAQSNNRKKDSFGLDILKTIAGGDTAQFGQESYARPVPKKSASQSHIDAIQQMIKKSQNK